MGKDGKQFTIFDSNNNVIVQTDYVKDNLSALEAWVRDMVTKYENGEIKSTPTQSVTNKESNNTNIDTFQPEPPTSSNASKNN